MKLALKKVYLSVALLLSSVSVFAQEQALVQRLYEAQMSGNDSAFYEAHNAFMNHLEHQKDWQKYYRMWMNRVIYEVNNKHFYRAYTEISRIINDIRKRNLKEFLYVSNMSLGIFYNGHNLPEMGEKYFRLSLEGIDVENDPVTTFNAYLSLAQSLSFNRPAEAMACLDSLPKQMLKNPMYDSGVLGYRCIIANKLGDKEAFNRYFARYDSIRRNQKEQFNSTNLQQVMVCRYLMQNDYKSALAWCDSINVPLTATELRMNVYEQMGDWERAYRAAEIKDSLSQASEREVLEEDILDMTQDIALLQAEQDKSELRRTQLVVVGIMAIVIIGMLIGILIYRHQKNKRMREQFLQLQEARRNSEAGQAIRLAFVKSMQEKLDSPISVLRNYARIFNDPNFRLKPDERAKRYNDIVVAARSIDSLMDPVLDSYAQGTSGITEKEKKICFDALRSPLLTLINTAEVILDGNGQIPHDEYMQMRSVVCREAYHVASSTHEFLLFSIYSDDFKDPKNDRIGMNEIVMSILNSYDLHTNASPLSPDRPRLLTAEFKSSVPDDVVINVSSLLQELLNCLLDNADKYATGGTVLVSCHGAADGSYAISVSNEGPVIPSEEAERIFEPFVRLSSDEHSLGIGLALAHRLATAMGYNISLDRNYTKGARFVITGIS